MSDWQDDYSDLSWFDNEYKPEAGFAPDLKTLPDGVYDFEVVKANLTKANNGDRILALDLKTEAGTYQRTYWLKTQFGMNQLGADLVLLGFPADKWGAGPGKVSVAEGLPPTVAKLVGIRFRGTKSTRTKDGATYADLHIGSRLGGATVPPKSPPTSKPATRPPTPPVKPPATPSTEEEAEILF